jgi:BASS family bile acid:Na+ symporter
VDFVLAVIFAVGIIQRHSVVRPLAAPSLIAHVNNVLMIVFSAQFFGPTETMTAAMYLLPFFALVLPLRYYGGRAGAGG